MDRTMKSANLGRARRFLPWLVAVPALLLLLAAMPVAPFKRLAERLLSSVYERPVSIVSLERRDPISFAPRLRLTGLAIGQPGWAGRGEMLRIERIEMRLPVLPLLVGKVRPRDIAIAGLEADLIRARDGRENWRKGKGGEGDKGGKGGPLSVVSLSGGHVRYRDAKRDRSADVRVAIDAQGLRLTGTGKVLGSAVRVAARGMPIRPGRWPFAARISGQSIDFGARGTMDGPLDLSRLDARVVARADNLTYLDAIIEAGLPATQPVRLTATVRRDRPDWHVRALTGTIGRSDVRGSATILKRDGRHRIDGQLSARQFDFDDLADARGRSIAVAKRARFGKRLFPDTAIDLGNVERTDGRLRLHVDRLLSSGPSPLRSLDGTLVVERSLLTIDDLRIGLTHGVLAGRVAIDQRKGRPVFRTDLRLRGGQLADFAPGMGFDAPLAAMMRLEGPGKTIRAAIGHSNGRIALVARDGALPDKAARLLGQELGGLFKDKKERARLRCLIVRLDAKAGTAVANPILIDTSRAVTRAEGRITLADERLALLVHGVPKRGGTLRIDGRIPLNGTIKAPAVAMPEGRGAVGTLLHSIGSALDGKKDPVAADEDCAALAARAMAG